MSASPSDRRGPDPHRNPRSLSERSETKRPSLRTIGGAFVLDVILVVLFAAIGRASHDEEALAGLWYTAWPFLAGLVVGWAVTLAWRAPAAQIRTGLGLWAVTVAGGMVLRALTGQGVVPAFVIVASIVLFLFLVGWRLIAALVGRGRVRRATARTLER